MKNLFCLLMLAACVALLSSSEKSIETLIKEAEQGAADAQFNLGMAYENGLGVPQDNIFAYMWFDIAASNAYEIDVNGFSAQVLLGIQMISDDIEEAKKRAKICLESNYKQCD